MSEALAMLKPLLTWKRVAVALLGAALVMVAAWWQRLSSEGHSSPPDPPAETKAAPSRVWLAAEFGVAAGETSSTVALQRAIDACAAGGGGTVRLPPGETTCGTIRLGSRTTLEVPEGSVLRASRHPREFAEGVWILADRAEDVAIRGGGRLVGNGSSHFRLDPLRIALWVAGGRATGMVEHPVAVKPRAYTFMLQFVQCKGVTLHGLRIEDSQHWTVHLLACDGVRVDGVRVKNAVHGPYTDGFDIDSCNDVVVRDCEVTAGDDAFCVKSTNKRGLARDSGSVLFENCVARSPTNGFKIGTETHAGISRVTFRGCRVEAPWVGMGPLGGVTIVTADGGDVSDVTVDGMRMTSVRCPVFLRRGNRAAAKRTGARPGLLRNVSLRDVRVDSCTSPVTLSGLPGFPVENVSFDGLRVETRVGPLPVRNPDAIPEAGSAYPESTMFGPLPAWGVFARHVSGLRFQDCVVGATTRAEAEAMVVAIDVSDQVGSPAPSMQKGRAEK